MEEAKVQISNKHKHNGCQCLLHQHYRNKEGNGPIVRPRMGTSYKVRPNHFVIIKAVSFAIGHMYKNIEVDKDYADFFDYRGKNVSRGIGKGKFTELVFTYIEKILDYYEEADPRTLKHIDGEFGYGTGAVHTAITRFFVMNGYIKEKTYKTCIGGASKNHCTLRKGFKTKMDNVKKIAEHKAVEGRAKKEGKQISTPVGGEKTEG